MGGHARACDGAVEGRRRGSSRGHVGGREYCTGDHTEGGHGDEAGEDATTLVVEGGDAGCRGLSTWVERAALAMQAEGAAGDVSRTAAAAFPGNRDAKQTA